MAENPRSYQARTYAFAEHLVTVRARAALTQSALATAIGVHHRTVQNWETGVSYPRAETLRRLLAALLQHGVFSLGQESAEARALWNEVAQASTQATPPFDEEWFAGLLLASSPQEADAGPTHPALDPVRAPRARIDWGEASAATPLYGRAHELHLLQQWGVADRCRVVGLFGLGGIGKSSLAVTFAQYAAAQFEHVLFRSLQNGPPLADLLARLIGVISDHELLPPPSLADQIALLVQLLRKRRCLLILDNFEAIFLHGEQSGTYRSGYEGYGALLQALGEREHQSCVILTSREKPPELGRLEGRTGPVRTLAVGGLKPQACQTILEQKRIACSPEDLAALVRLYDGNPLALQLVAEPLRELFGGDVAAFLATGDAFFNGVGMLLGRQMARSTPLEQAILYWLAIEREAVPLAGLRGRLDDRVSQRDLLGALESLRRRMLIERTVDRPAFSLQPVILEYVTNQLVETMAEEIRAQQPLLLQRYAFRLATAKEYVQHSQDQLIGVPLLERINRDATAEHALLALLAGWRAQPVEAQGYGPGNAVNLLRLLRGHLRGLDLSGLLLRQVSFQNVDLHDSSLAAATLRDVAWTGTFNGIQALSISADGAYWAAASEAGEVRVWEAGGVVLHRIWPSVSDMVWRVALSPDGRTLACGSWNGAVRLWDVAGGELRWASQPQAGPLGTLHFSPDGRLLLSSDDMSLQLWDALTGSLIQRIPQPSLVCGCGWSPDGRRFASSHAEGTIRLWELGPDLLGREAWAIDGHPHLTAGLAFSPDGATLASGSWDGTVKLWAVAGGTLIDTLAHGGRVSRVAWSPDGATLACSGREAIVRLWDIAQRRVRAVLPGHTGYTRGLAFTPDGAQLLTGSEDGTLRLWDVASGQYLRCIQGYTGTVNVTAWSPDDRALLSGNFDGSLTIWDVAGGRVLRALQGHRGSVIAVSWSANGRWLASTELDTSVFIWDAHTGRLIQTLQHPDGAHICFVEVSWSPDGQRLICLTLEAGVLMWDMLTQRVEWLAPEVILHSFVGFTWSPDGTLVAIAAEDGSVSILRSADGALLQRLTQDNGVTGLAWSPDGVSLALLHYSDTGTRLCVWDTRRWILAYTATLPDKESAGLEWGAMPATIITASFDGKLRWWDMERDEFVRIRLAHEGVIQSFSCSLDRTTLATCGKDGAIRLWDIASGALLQTLRRDRPYERMDITGRAAITAAQRTSLLALGAVERLG